MTLHSKTMNSTSNISNTKYKAITAAISLEIGKLRQNVLKSNLIELNELCDAELKLFLNWKRQVHSANRNECNQKADRTFTAIAFIAITLFCLVIGLCNFNVAAYFLSIRCFVPNNYMIWEATRPVSNCEFCAGIQRPLILPNVSEAEFLVSILIEKKNVDHFFNFFF